MATTIPAIFAGTPSIDADKAAQIYAWYVEALADSDKAGSMEDASYYEGAVNGFYTALCVIYGYNPQEDEEVRQARAFFAEHGYAEGDEPLCGDAPAPCNCWDAEHKFPGSGPKPEAGETP